jgi:ABC-2 type transport system ATP-binding protein
VTQQPPANAIEVRRLVKRFGDYVAVDQVDLEIRQGELLALLGPNGAGKSTTIKILTTLLAPDEGSVTIGDFRLPEQAEQARRLLGLVPQEIAVYDVLSPRRNLSFFGALYGLQGTELAGRVSELLEGVNLADRADQAIHTFSGGMQRRVNIAAALVHEPKIVFLDEPTVGLDPALRDDIWKIIRQLKARGTTLVLTTHYMEEAEALCDRVAIMDRGKVVAIGSPGELLAQTGVKTSLVLSVTGDVAAGRDAVRKLPDAAEVEAIDGRLRLTTSAGSQALPDVIRTLLAAGCQVNSAEVQAPNLGAVYRHFTGHDLGQEP